jgi:molybdopterin synthase catalytic subunit/molybdopterin synthase sulfur carrier subunit
MRILFFAHLREATGVSIAEIVTEGVTADRLWSLLIERWPALAAHRDGIRLARNGVYVQAEEVFGNNDEVALIPPVSGG